MPEGDTLFAAQQRLRRILLGQPVDAFWARRLRGLTPRRGMGIVGVDAVGKHLLIAFDRGLVLQTHLGMTGAWKTLPADIDLRVFADRNPTVRVLIRTTLGTAACFAAPTISTFVRDHDIDPTSHLGPNLTADTIDVDEVSRRLGRFHPADSLLVDVLLDQRVAAGIGNVYKSEVLYLHRIGPERRLTDHDAAASLFVTAHTLLRRNIAEPTRRRVTTPAGFGGSNHWVYGRFRLPCLTCGTAIERVYNGADNRSTYWCPTCQLG